MDESELEDAIESVLDEGEDLTGERSEEWFLTDWESPLKIGEYTDVFALNEQVEELEDAVEDSYLPDEVIEDFLDENGDISELDNIICIEADTELDLGYNYVEELCGGIENLSRETLAQFFDYEAFGKCLQDDGFTPTENYYYCCS